MLVGSNSAGDGSTLGADNRSAAQVSTDDAISATIRSRFAADTALRAANLTVTTRDNNVTLAGEVAAFSDRDRAVRIAGNTDDVRAVNNQISVNTQR
jgi:osmotically-inducible protein OsmY